MRTWGFHVSRAPGRPKPAERPVGAANAVSLGQTFQLLHRASRDPRRMKRVALLVQRPGRQSRARTGRCASLERSSLRADCPAMLGPVSPARNSLRSLRSLRSNNRAESDHDSRCARGHEPCASRRPRGAARPVRARLCRGVASHAIRKRCSAAGAARRGRCVGRRGAQVRGRRAYSRASLSDSPRLFERSERSERSEFCGATRV